jgi:hypothetical protein
MNLQKLKNTVEEYIMEDELDPALHLLKAQLNPAGRSWKDFVLIKGKFNRINKQTTLGKMSFKEAEEPMDEIVESLHTLNKELTEQDILSNSSGEEFKWIRDKIAIISHSSDANQNHETRRFFQKLRFKNAKVVHLTVHQDLEELLNFEDSGKEKDDKIKLVIFDNTDLPSCGNEKEVTEQIKNRIKLMQEFADHADQSDYLFIHYGKYLYWLNDKEVRRRFYSANSRFALYARVKEMLDFIATINV